jgi:hypothetical protein
VIPGAARDRIRTLRAIGPSCDPLALRLKLERTFESLDLRASGLSPCAIVCVRRMRVAAGRRERWTEAVNGQLQSLAVRAVRPFRQAVPADADVILFEDEAELLACLARDSWRGGLDAWWWRGLFGTDPTSALVRSLFTAAATVVPAAIDRLARAFIAAEVVRSLPSIDCEEIGLIVAATFAVPAWAADAPSAPHPTASLSTAREADILTSTRVARLSATIEEVPPADLALLSEPQRALLVLALVLCRAPALARMAGFAPALRSGDWLQRLNAPSSEAPAAPGIPIGAKERAHYDVLPADSRLEDVDHQHSENRARHAPHVASHDANRTAHSPDMGATRERGELIAADAPGRAIPGWHDPVEPMAYPDLAHRSSEWLREVDSEYAGVLYLVNIALHLELYGDFTQPERPGIPLPLGDLLAIVGQRVCGPAIRTDGIWELLADLAGRDVKEPPGVEFEPPDHRDLDRFVDDHVRMFASFAAAALDQAEDSVLQYLCCRPGHISLSLTRLEATYSLATHPLTIRVACFDRNPGWIPSAGRVIAFHFE